jgi:cytosine permease
MPSKLSGVAAQMDRLYEFDREPVSEEKLHGPRRFAALFAGEHVAATEFVIGAFFVLHGVSAKDVVGGLLLGNLLAVLSWTFLCAPIAVRTRLTLYWYLRRIAGPGMTMLYNLANAVFFCIIAGAMVSVASTAAGLLFGIPVPELTDVYPSSLSWAALTFSIGVVFTLLAILGFEKLSDFATICSPWIFVVFIAGAVATLPRLGVLPDLSNFWEVAQTRIWTGVPAAGQERYEFGQIVFFAWFCNLAMHVGLSDMALFRYARKWYYGLCSFTGMYLGHFLAWICSGIMIAGVDRQMDPGRMAYTALGLAGILGLMLAGWTTANPTMYRVGLALQTLTPGWPRWKVTLLAGIVMSVLSCFPVFFLRLLDNLAIFGIVLMPVGAIVFAEHWLLPRLGVEQYRAERERQFLNKEALAAWVAAVAFCYWLPVHLFFKWLPGYFVALLSYVILRKAADRPVTVETREAAAK